MTRTLGAPDVRGRAVAFDERNDGVVRHDELAVPIDILAPCAGGVIFVAAPVDMDRFPGEFARRWVCYGP